MSDDATRLIERAKQGDKVALEKILVIHYNHLFRHIAGRMPTSRNVAFSAEDVTQDALLEAFLKMKSVRVPALVRSNGLQTSKLGFSAQSKSALRTP